MKVLLINQFFWPDFAATGQFLADLARHLAQQGHDVTVICGRGAYPGSGYNNDPPPVRIRRVPAVPFVRRSAVRALSYLSFMAGALCLSLTVDRPDLVLTLTTPPLLSVVGTLLKRLKGSQHYIWEMDLFPDALVSLGALKAGSVSARFLGRIADYSRHRADGIIALGPCMCERLLKRGIARDQIHIVENWADGRQITPMPYGNGGPLHLVYSGNLGLSHDIETIAWALERLQDDRRFFFSFIGGGARRSELETFCRSRRISNIAFRPYRTRDQVADSLASADIGLVTMKDECIGTVVPSKVYGIMAAQRPILFIGPRSATPALLVRKHDCGWQVDCGDVGRLIQLLERLSEDRRLVWNAGARAREAFLGGYDLEHGTAKLSAVLRLTEGATDTSGDQLDCAPSQLPLDDFEVLR
jgi:glycosyltransferase involved in cell wall biosynthesis